MSSTSPSASKLTFSCGHNNLQSFFCPACCSDKFNNGWKKIDIYRDFTSWRQAVVECAFILFSTKFYLFGMWLNILQLYSCKLFAALRRRKVGHPHYQPSPPRGEYVITCTIIPFVDTSLYPNDIARLWQTDRHVLAGLALRWSPERASWLGPTPLPSYR